MLSTTCKTGNRHTFIPKIGLLQCQSSASHLAGCDQKIPEGLIQKQDPKDHCLAEPGKLPTSYVMCTHGQRQIGQAGPVWSSVVLLSAMYVMEAMQ